jgi:ubiquitin-protein ligase
MLVNAQPHVYTTCRKRFNHEIAELLDNVSEEINVKYTKDDILIFLKITPTSRDFAEITLTKEYPFRPPKIRINEETYYNFMLCNSPRMNSIVHQAILKKSLINSSITNRDNWTPAFGIMYIIDEIRLINNIKAFAKYLMCLDEISYANRIPEVMIYVIIEFIMGEQILSAKDGFLRNTVFEKYQEKKQSKHLDV